MKPFAPVTRIDLPFMAFPLAFRPPMSDGPVCAGIELQPASSGVGLDGADPSERGQEEGQKERTERTSGIDTDGPVGEDAVQ